MNIRLAAALVLLAGEPAFAHRLDEYLQGTILSVERNRVQAALTLTPGAAVLPVVMAYLDSDHDGAISGDEQRAYTASVLRDLSISADGRRLTPQLISARFPTMDEMREGRGEIHIELDVPLPEGGRGRRFRLENRHLGRISAYQVNALVPHDPAIQVTAQKRNYSQSEYELDFARTDVAASSDRFPAGSTRNVLLLAFTAALVCVRLSFASARKARNIP